MAGVLAQPEGCKALLAMSERSVVSRICRHGATGGPLTMRTGQSTERIVRSAVVPRKASFRICRRWGPITSRSGFFSATAFTIPAKGSDKTTSISQVMPSTERSDCASSRSNVRASTTSGSTIRRGRSSSTTCTRSSTAPCALARSTARRKARSERSEKSVANMIRCMACLLLLCCSHMNIHGRRLV